jgi:hypothetical protein
MQILDLDSGDEGNSARYLDIRNLFRRCCRVFPESQLRDCT